MPPTPPDPNTVLPRIDLVLILLYLTGTGVLGFWMARRISNLGDYFMPRRFGPGMLMMHAFGTGTAADQAVVVASATFRSGLSGIWYQWLWLFATPFYWLIAPMMRRFRALTTADVYALRFDRSVASLFALVGMASLVVKIGLLLKGAGALVESGTGGLVSAEFAIPAITVLFVAYGMAGGLGAAIVTDFFQGLLTVLFSFLILPFVWNAVGGFAGIKRVVTDPEMLSLVAPGEIGIFFILMFSLQALIGIVAQPFVMGICAAGRTEWDGRFGFMVGNFIKRICTVAWSLTGIAALGWYLQQEIDLASLNPDHVYGEMARTFLPTILPGLLGIFIAGLLASIMSSCDSYMISSAALFTENIYKPLRPPKSQKHYLWVGRLATLAVVGAGVAFSFWLPNVVKGLSIWFKIAPMLGMAFWLGIFWPRTTSAGAWSGTLAGFAIWWLTTQNWFLETIQQWPMISTLGMVGAQGGSLRMHEPWQIAFYLSAALAAAILASLVSRPTPPEKLDRFYSLLLTPVQAGEIIEQACQLPAQVRPGSRRIFLTRFGLWFPAPSRTSTLGFVAGWVAVAALIIGFKLWLETQ